MIASFEVIELEGAERRSKLLANINYFVSRLREENFDVKQVQASIIPIMLYDEDLMMDMAQYSHSHGVYIMPVGYSAVPRGMERLRMNLTYHHDKKDLDHALNILLQAREVCHQVPIELALFYRCLRLCFGKQGRLE